MNHPAWFKVCFNSQDADFMPNSLLITQILAGIPLSIKMYIPSPALGMCILMKQF